MGDWPRSTKLSAYHISHGKATRLAPQAAYTGMPEDARLAAAICDSAISNEWGFADSMLLVVLGETVPSIRSRTQKLFDSKGWVTVEDAFDAANLTKRQRVAYTMHLARFTDLEVAQAIGFEVGKDGKERPVTRGAIRQRIIDSEEKLKRVMEDNPSGEEELDGACSVRGYEASYC